MPLASNFEKILEKQITRREFLVLCVGFFITAVGLGRFFKVLDLPKRVEGFGTGPYGGAKK